MLWLLSRWDKGTKLTKLPTRSQKTYGKIPYKIRTTSGHSSIIYVCVYIYIVCVYIYREREINIYCYPRFKFLGLGPDLPAFCFFEASARFSWIGRSFFSLFFAQLYVAFGFQSCRTQWEPHDHGELRGYLWRCWLNHHAPWVC